MLDSSTRELLCLWAARERGVLDALATEAGTPADVADTAGVDPAAADAFVTALADAGYVERVGDEYEPTNRLLGFLTKTDLRSVGSLPAALDAVDGWVALGEGDSFESPDALRNDLGAQWATDEATVRAAVTAAIRAAPGADAAAVVGDGPGRHARDLLARGLDATIVETPARADAVEPLLSPTAVRLEAGGRRRYPTRTSFSSPASSNVTTTRRVSGGWPRPPRPRRSSSRSALSATARPAGRSPTSKPSRGAKGGYAPPPPSGDCSRRPASTARSRPSPERPCSPPSGVGFNSVRAGVRTWTRRYCATTWWTASNTRRRASSAASASPRRCGRSPASRS
ncbi:hypothetical protein [Halosegnis marinus]|uniref:hypothetical protein n=1 Tax=Halosegnis marinus TaxID=3034023 RepID=UPI00361C6EFE